jgi:hypothetical protein
MERNIEAGAEVLDAPRNADEGSVLGGTQPSTPTSSAPQPESKRPNRATDKDTSVAERNANIKKSMVPAVSPRPWRRYLTIHPAANEMPDLDQGERLKLRGDLKAHGLREPVVMVRIAGGPEQLLDGRNRLDLLEENGEEVIDADGKLRVEHRVVDLADNDEALAYVISLNIHRRHIKLETRQKLIKRLLLSNPQMSDRKIAEKTNSDHKTVGKKRKEAEQRGEIPTFNTVIGRDNHKQPRKKASTKTRAKEPPKVQIEAAGGFAKEIAETVFKAPPTAPTPRAATHGDPAIAGNPISEAWRGASEDERTVFAKMFAADVQRYAPQGDVVTDENGAVT